MQRRDFLRRTALLGVAALAGSRLSPRALANPPGASASGPSAPGAVVAVESADAFAATLRAVTELGGIGRFVKPGTKVGLLINAPNWWRKPGSFTTPDLTLAVLRLCREAGAAEVTYVIDPASDYWTRTPLGAQHPELVALGRKNPGEWVEVEIPRAVTLKTAKVNRAFLDCEVLINLPIAKHHGGTGYTGCLKNFMGACHRSTNKTFHTNGGDKDEGDDIAHLSQCIADINLVRRADLHICDGTEFLLTNGPAGPGELRRANRIVAGTDPVAVDAYACTLLGLTPDKVTMIGLAAQHGLGNPDLAKAGLREVQL